VTGFDRARPIADAVLFEGYALYPYRASAVKNQRRFAIGDLSPKAYAQAQAVMDPFELTCECLIEGTAGTEIEAWARFLHARAPDERGWEERVPREVGLGPVCVADLTVEPRVVRFAFGGRGAEPRIEGEIALAALRLEDGVYRVAVRVTNTLPIAPIAADAREAGLRSLGSAHAILCAREGKFVSLLDPGEALRAHAEACKSRGAWPVLAGEPGSRDLVLCSPIILYDHPAVAPESPGDLFDGTEMDEMLSLRILTLTESEKREAAALDGRVRALVARTEGLADEDLARLHGAVRARRTVQAGGVEIGPGDRVLLRPSGRSDVFDLALAGQAATVRSIEQDYEARTFVTVTVDGDPGEDLGAQGLPGHRFFFRPDEVEPIPRDEGGRR
jgi:hypothetical protein